MSRSRLIERAFRLGWEAGNRRGEASAREAERLLRGLLRRMPSCEEVEVFCNGSLDGALNDRWRLDYDLREVS